MEEIIKNLQEIVNAELIKCKENKTMPNEATLGIIKLIMTYHSYKDC